MRLIDADAFLEENKELADCDFIHPSYGDTLRELIENAPTVDAVEVVRCKDCKCFDSDMEWCDADDHPISPDAFCSYAERRDG